MAWQHDPLPYGAYNLIPSWCAWSRSRMLVVEQGARTRVKARKLEDLRNRGISMIRIFAPSVVSSFRASGNSRRQHGAIERIDDGPSRADFTDPLRR